MIENVNILLYCLHLGSRLRLTMDTHDSLHGLMFHSHDFNITLRSWGFNIMSSGICLAKRNTSFLCVDIFSIRLMTVVWVNFESLLLHIGMSMSPCKGQELMDRYVKPEDNDTYISGFNLAVST